MHLHFSGRCGPINNKTPYRSNITFSKNIYKQTQGVWLHLQLPLLGQEVLCRGTKEEAGDQTTDAVFFFFSRLHRKCRNFWPGSRTWRVTTRILHRPGQLCSRGQESPRKSLCLALSTTGTPRSRSTKGSMTDAA